MTLKLALQGHDLTELESTQRNVASISPYGLTVLEEKILKDVFPLDAKFDPQL